MSEFDVSTYCWPGGGHRPGRPNVPENSQGGSGDSSGSIPSTSLKPARPTWWPDWLPWG